MVVETNQLSLVCFRLILFFPFFFFDSRKRFIRKRDVIYLQTYVARAGAMTREMEDAAVPGYIHDRNNWLIYIQKNKSQMLTLGLPYILIAF